MNLEAVFGQDADISDVVLIAIYELEKGLQVCEFSDLDLVNPLAKFSSHGV